MRKKYTPFSRSRKGFTIVELLLAMSFVAVLMVTIAFLVIRITAIYQKGLTVRSINQVGRNLISDFTRAVSDSPMVTFNAIYADGNPTTSLAAVPPRRYDFVENRVGGLQYQGAFCTGRYSYIWNTGDAINETNGPGRWTYEYRDGGGVRQIDFRLLRVDDSSRGVCRLFATYLQNPGLLGSRRFSPASLLAGDINHAATAQAVPIEMLSLSGGAGGADLVDTSTASEIDLAIYDMHVFPPTLNSVTGHSFYSATFTLATLRGNVDLTATGNYCQDPSETLNTDFSYCAFNKFNFSIRTTGDTDGSIDDDYGSIR
jgi:type II secretory pathway pseudopilin PulG